MSEFTKKKMWISVSVINGSAFLHFLTSRGTLNYIFSTYMYGGIIWQDSRFILLSYSCIISKSYLKFPN